MGVEFSEVAVAGEVLGSGDPLVVPEGYAMVEKLEKMDKQELAGATVLYDWDSGWEVGLVGRVTGRGNKRSAVVRFDIGESDKSDEHTVELDKSTYGTRWVLLTEVPEAIAAAAAAVAAIEAPGSHA